MEIELESFGLSNRNPNGDKTITQALVNLQPN